MKSKTKRILTMILCFALAVVLGGEVFLSAFSVKAEAAEIKTHTTVTADLNKDPNFDRSLYPAKDDDYSLTVFQVAESAEGNLYIYVYQPSDSAKDLKASKINMSLQSNTEKNPSYSIYDLVWLSSEGVFDKYLVKDFTISEDMYRYYNIASISRAYDASIDASLPEADDTKGYVAYKVGICFCAYYYNNNLIYEAASVDVVEIEILAVGSVRYDEGFKLYVDKCDSHFVAFSLLNYDATKIVDATVGFYTYEYRENWSAGVGSSVSTTEPVWNEIDITDKEQGSNEGDGFLGKKYTWNRILTKDDFKKQLEEFKNEDVVFQKGGLDSAQFVFQFLETSYSLSVGLNSWFEYSTKVENVTILRLHFLTSEGTYNLGVVSDFVSDDGVPDFVVTVDDNLENYIEELKPFFELIVQLILLVIVIAAVCAAFTFITPLKVLLNICIKAVRLLLRLATWPIRFLLGLLLGRKKEE